METWKQRNSFLIFCGITAVSALFACAVPAYTISRTVLYNYHYHVHWRRRYEDNPYQIHVANITWGMDSKAQGPMYCTGVDSPLQGLSADNVDESESAYSERNYYMGLRAADYRWHEIIVHKIHCTDVDTEDTSDKNI